jgi:myo-inositol 2-dehydrogenase / D-chiro-inositol 1-dehydrogenase
MVEKLDLSRRSFVKSGIAASTAVSSFAIFASRDARAQAPISVGVIGCGGRGRGAMINALQANEGVQIKALADIFPEKIELAKRELQKMDKPIDGIKEFLGFTSYKPLVNEDLDYVILATPPCYRPETLEAAVEAKKHVFMEKPAAVDAPGIRRIIAAGEKAKQYGLSIAAGTQRRHQQSYIETINRLHDGAIGDIVNGQTFWCGGPIGYPDRKPGMTEIEYQIRGWYHWMWLSGDHILEQHVHNIDVLNWIMGAHPVKAFGVGGKAWTQNGNIWDHHAVHFEYPSGVSILSMCSQYPRATQRVDERVQGTKGHCYTNSNDDCYIVSNGNKWAYQGKCAPYIQEHINLIDSIQNNKGLNEARNVAESTMTAVMGRLAGQTGKEMSWEEAYHSNESFPVYYELGNPKTDPAPVPGGNEFTGEEGWKPG